MWKFQRSGNSENFDIWAFEDDRKINKFQQEKRVPSDKKFEETMIKGFSGAELLYMRLCLPDCLYPLFRLIAQLPQIFNNRRHFFL